ncbi:MAG: hypothetical protein AB7Q42_08210 [Acidimicrobiia bacterium]
MSDTTRMAGSQQPEHARPLVPPTAAGAPSGARLDLYWIPLGAGAHVVRISGKTYEALAALVQRRPRRDLYHSALIATVGDDASVIEMTPIPRDRGGHDRGVVGEGAVGTRWAGRFRIFRYELRRWRGGVVPDLSFAVSSPVRVADVSTVVEQVLRLVPLVPTPVWGRDELGAGEMWNSNSVISWVLTQAGICAEAGVPPGGGRAPGWDAGVLVAQREVLRLPRPITA